MADEEVEVSTEREEHLPEMIDHGDAIEVSLEPEKPAREPREERAAPVTLDAATMAARAAIAATQEHRAAQPQVDPYDAQERQIADQERALGLEWEVLKTTKALTPQKAEEYDAKARGLQQQRANIGAQRALQNAMPQMLAAQQQQRYQQQYKDVHDNPSALRYARGYFDQQVAQGAREDDNLVEKAMNAARVAFRMGGTAGPSVSSSERSRYMAAPNSGGSTTKAPTVRLGKAEKSMALSMYGDRFNGDEKKSYAAWAKGPGAKALKALAKQPRNS